jgi:DNA-binding XRE family transcriptional regulator
VTEPVAYGHGVDPIEVVPVVVLSQVFPARPSSIPDIRDFVRRCLAESPLTDEGNREVGETVFRALLDAAGPTGSIQVAFRIFPEHVEVDVLHSDSLILARSPGVPAGGPANGAGPANLGMRGAPVTGTVAPAQAAAAAWADPAAAAPSGLAAPAVPAGPAPAAAASAPTAGAPAGPAEPAAPPSPAEPVMLGGPGQPSTFAEWMSTALRREGLTQEAAARQLGVSVKTVSRWVGGATEPRMRDLRRIQEVFGQVPLP